MFQVFCDGEDILKKIKSEYITHSKGFFILAPSGSGKTHFVKSQTTKDWIDGDDLWMATGAQPKTEWWAQGLEVINEVEQKCDVITKEAKENGLWIIGASNFWLMPDAIVLPNLKTNKKFIIKRENTNYDGGAKSDAFDQLISHRSYMKKLARKNKIPIFKTIEEADLYLRNLDK